MLSKKHSSAGFTLIELLVVIAIIGTLSSVVMATMGSVREQARDTRRDADVVQIINALELHYADHTHYPCSATMLLSKDSGFLQELVDGGYISHVPDDPLGNNSFFYEYRSFSETPDGQCGQSVYIGTYTEQELDIDGCPFGGRRVSPNHCHILYPVDPPCSDPYNDSLPSDCQDLAG